MYAMQYSVQLPTDYDMQIIRDRVTSKGHLLDGFSGLRFKAYLIREKAKGAPGNEYAPFYVWNDIDGMRAFCWGEPGYSSIVRDFGRHPIQDWTIVDVARGPANVADAKSLVLIEDRVPVDAAPAEAIEALTRNFLDSSDPDTVWRVAAVDVTTWTVILVEVSAAAVPRQSAVEGASYEVLHVSEGPRP